MVIWNHLEHNFRKVMGYELMYRQDSCNLISIFTQKEDLKKNPQKSAYYQWL